MRKAIVIVLPLLVAGIPVMMGLPQAKAACVVEPTSLDFGAFCSGGGYNRLEKTFTITNTGPDTVNGTVTEACEHYSIPEGGGDYSLAAGESLTVTVRFEPTAGGRHTCTIDTGNPLCDDVSCEGIGDTTCEVSPLLLHGDVCVGSHLDNTFTITNMGEETLSGTVRLTLSQPQYSIVNGGGPYSLSPGESREVTVRFTPTFAGILWERVDTGHALCCDVFCACSGRGCCWVYPFELDFGELSVGSYLDKTFEIRNQGDETFSVNVTEPSEHYSILDGGGAYSLEPDEFRKVTVRFEPRSPGQHDCRIEMGSPFCGDNWVSCSGTGWPASCQVSPATLRFDAVGVGDHRDCRFTIVNRGRGLLTGSVGAPCDHYSIISGEGAYKLGYGKWVTVTVRFEPDSAGGHDCTIETGNSACGDVSCTGFGLQPVVPALTEWGLVAMTIALIGAGAVVLRKRLPRIA